MENIKTIAFRGSSDLIGNLQLCIDHISVSILFSALTRMFPKPTFVL